MKTKTLEEKNNIEETIWKNAIKEQFGEDVYTSREIKEDFQKKGMTKEEIKESFLRRYSPEEVERIMNNLYPEEDNYKPIPLVFCS